MDENITWVGVLDLLGGRVVRAIGGKRSHYQPWCPANLNTSDPLAIAESFRIRHGINTLYVADLDALAGRPPAFTVIKRLVSAGFHVTLDCGPRTTGQLDQAFHTGVETVVIPLETGPTWPRLQDWCEDFDVNRLAFGLDLFAGVPLAPLPHPENARETHPPADDIRAFSNALATLNLRKIIVLDLHTVGRQSGPTTLPLCHDMHLSQPTLQIWTGGGFRNQQDIDRAAASGVTGVLLATALHEETLTRQNHAPLHDP